MLVSNQSSRKSSFLPHKKSSIDIDLAAQEKDESFLQKREFISSWFKEDNENCKWQDPDDDNIEIDLTNQARLRKIMRKNGKTVVKGTEYQEMMKDYYYEKQKKFDFFKWASNDTNDTALTIDKSNNISSLLQTTNNNLFYTNKNL